MAEPPGRGRLECCACGRVLERQVGRSLDGALACSMATLLLLVPAYLMPVMTVRFAGLNISTHLVAGVGTAWHQGWFMLGAILALLAVILPLARFSLLTATLLAIRWGHQGVCVGRAFRYCELLDPWAMSDVLLVGGGIGFGRIDSQIPVRIDAGGWCFVAAAIMTMLSRAALERRAIWRAIHEPGDYEGPDAIGCAHCDLVLPSNAEGRPCPRCAVRVDRRRPYAISQTLALLIATVVLTPLAYSQPMSEMWKAGTPDPHGILNGIGLLFSSGFWYFGIIIACVSVLFPLTKIVALSWFLASIWNCSAVHLRRKTELYRFVDDVGRWSTLDPFTVMVFAPMVQIETLAHIDIMPGSLSFTATVVLSMLAARAFDPRLMWDVAREPILGKAAGTVAAGKPSRALSAGFIRCWTLDRVGSATNHRSGGNHPRIRA